MLLQSESSYMLRRPFKLLNVRTFRVLLSLRADSNLRTRWQQSILTDSFWYQGQVTSLKVPPWFVEVLNVITVLNVIKS